MRFKDNRYKTLHLAKGNGDMLACGCKSKRFTHIGGLVNCKRCRVTKYFNLSTVKRD